MKTSTLLAAVLAAIVTCSSLSAATLNFDTVNYPLFGDAQRVDSLTINFDPIDGSVTGLPGTQVGWNFTANFSSNAGDWLAITSISFDGNQTNGVFTPGGGFYIGPNPFSGSAGTYFFNSDAIPGASDPGPITFNFDLYDGNPDLGNYIDTQSLSVDAVANVDLPIDTGSDAPEPGTWLMILSGAAALFATRALRSKQKLNSQTR